MALIRRAIPDDGAAVHRAPTVRTRRARRAEDAAPVVPRPGRWEAAGLADPPIRPGDL